MKRIVVAIPYGLAFRNLACSGVLRYLVEHECEVTVLLPPIAKEDRAHVEGELPSQVRVESLHIGKHSVPYQLLKFLKQHYYGERTQLESFAIKKRYRHRDSPVWDLLASAVEKTASTVVSEAMLDDWLLKWKYPFETRYVRCLQEWRADAVVVTKPGYHPDELALIKAARRVGAPTISVDTTWDNMVSKRPPYILPDAVTVWNKGMAEQALAHYQMRDGSVSITGGVQFDTFFRKRPTDRTRTLQQHGLDPAKPLVVFGLSNPDFTAGTPDFARGFISRVIKGEIRGEPNVIIRTHPWDPGKTDYTAGFSYPRLRLEHPYRLPHAGTKFECLAARCDVERQGALYQAADVIVNVAGTTSLDGIAVDVPVVNIAFDAVAPAHPDVSVTRFSSYSHYRPILESGAVRLASSWEELCAHVNAAMRDPQSDAPARARARQQFLGQNDEHACDRVAGAILASSGA
jgi:hypothetical protein